MNPSQEELLKSIHDAVCGNEEYGRPGLIQVQKEHDKRIRSQEMKWRWMVGVYAGVTATSGFLVFKGKIILASIGGIFS